MPEPRPRAKRAAAANPDASPDAAATAPPPDSLTPYHRTIRTLSDRIVEAQRPIRILDACKWDDAVEKRFFEKNATEMPAVSHATYENAPLGFDVEAKQREFYDIERDVRRELGMLNQAGRLMVRQCKE